MANTNNTLQKKALKSIVRNSLNKKDAIKALTGEDEEPHVLKLIIGGCKGGQKWFLNGEPISKERFWQIEEKRMNSGKVGRVTVKVGNKILGGPTNALDDEA